MKTSTDLLLFIGLGLFTILVGYHGVTDVAAAPNGASSTSSLKVSVISP